MATYLLDTNILLRMSDSSSPVHLLAGRATASLFRQGHNVYITTQNIIEFWAVATRPLAVNGLGWNIDQTRTEVEVILNQFPLLQDTPQVLVYWLNYVTSNRISGKRVHDARLVAIMQVHEVTHLLTFNADDFISMEGITIVHPLSVTEVES